MTFIIRVELHNAQYEDYQRLHRAMEAAGFSRQIEGSNGKRYHLPPAEYTIDTQSSGEVVRTSAKNAANTTGKGSAVLVSQATSVLWIGLDEVTNVTAR